MGEISKFICQNYKRILALILSRSLHKIANTLQATDAYKLFLTIIKQAWRNVSRQIIGSLFFYILRDKCQGNNLPHPPPAIPSDIIAGSKLYSKKERIYSSCNIIRICAAVQLKWLAFNPSPVSGW